MKWENILKNDSLSDKEKKEMLEELRMALVSSNQTNKGQKYFKKLIAEMRTNKDMLDSKFRVLHQIILKKLR